MTGAGYPFGKRPARQGLLALAGLLLALLAVLGLSLMTGTYALSPGAVWATLTGQPPDDMAATVLFEFRLPRALVAIGCGAMMALSGAVLQGLTRNGLADPSLMGVSQGAALAVVGLIVLFPQAGSQLRAPCAFAGSLVVAAIVLRLSGGRQGAGALRLVLTGVGVAAFLSALTSALMTHGNLQEAQSALGWLSGSVNAAGWTDVRSLALCGLILIPGAAAMARPLGPLRFGPDVAAGLGVALHRAQAGAVLLAVTAAASATAVAGPLGFVGLIAPHLAARLVRTGPGLHLALSAAVGAGVVAAADLAGRSLFAPVQIPAGIVTALVGCPIFAALMLRGGPTRQP